ncbi:MAG: serine acetyltransferase [Actinobacteria bacterium]|nr:serine acetyltransferase [Actinomycetota bacterium]
MSERGIRSKADLRHYQEADLWAHGLPRWRPWLRISNRVVYFQRVLRIAEYYENCRHDPLGRFYMLVLRVRLRTMGERLGFEIPRGVFGPGLSIAHHGSVTVNGEAVVGSNCRIDAQTTIGDVRGGAPTIGDNVYIGSGARVLGAVTVGDEAAIGANAVVVDDVPSGVTVGGVPARVISQKGSRAVLGSPPLAPPPAASGAPASA